ALVSSAAMASSCPLQVKAIDAALASKTDISDDTLTKVKALRNEGEKLHKNGKHGESMSKLMEAKSMLGIK
ncbi:MAG: hypothetical protein OET44_18615, partial [Gammaproteobacteria bacterium]|nr:hypothetical protein [Gammaproteobacteria bacterium]